MNLFEQTLYVNHSSGKTGAWQVSVEALEDGQAQIVSRSWKVLGGNHVENRRLVTSGKNIGRANETTPSEQAVLEAKSKVSQKMDKGYTVEKPVAGAKATNGLGLTKPMLATEYGKVKNIPYPLIAQPKLDGNRCLAARINGSIQLWSRGGKFITLPHVSEALEPVLQEGQIVDGELYYHGQTLQTITSWIKKIKPESSKIEYHIYDLVDECNYQERLATLETMITDNHPTLRLVESRLINNEQQLMETHGAWVELGYEGTILRTGDNGYETKRSKALVKLKDFQDAEFDIVDVVAGTPRHLDGGTKLECAVYVCDAGNGQTFRVTAPGDMHAKHKAFIKRHQAIGKPLTVKFFNKTPAGIPYLPVALQIRASL